LDNRALGYLDGARQTECGKRGKASQSTIATDIHAESAGCVNDACVTFTGHNPERVKPVVIGSISNVRCDIALDCRRDNESSALTCGVCESVCRAPPELKRGHSRLRDNTVSNHAKSEVGKKTAGTRQGRRAHDKKERAFRPAPFLA
jgi:L-lactate utilization protein LutB